MKFIIACLVTAAMIIACNSGKKTNSLFSNPGDVKGDEYVITIDKDTVLQTKQGALLKIPKGSLQTDEGNTVTLEIKEAYSIQQMIKFGLTTQSNGSPLSSGGMIYINAVGGQKVTITQQIKLAIPADYLASNMELFKGEQTTDGAINWKDPVRLPENKQFSQVEQGKTLFQSKCTSCHSIGKNGTGPDLANILKRPFLAGDYGYPQFHSTIESRLAEIHGLDETYHYRPAEAYHCNLQKIFGSRPTLFPDLTFDDVLALYRYIQNESSQNSLPLPSHTYLDNCIDSCRVYKEKINSLEYKKLEAEQKRKVLIEDNGPMVDIKPEASPAIQNNEPVNPPINFDEKVSPKNYNATYYQFTIETFGWYNIDILLKDVAGVEDSELFVRIIGEYRERVKVFLIIPSEKVYGEGGPAERNPDEFAFFYKTGKLPLPQNVRAYIMAVTETSSSVAFSIKEFKTGRQQQLDIALTASTKQEFEAAIQRIGLDGMNITVNDAKNAGKIRHTDTIIRSIDEEIKKASGLKPTQCDCDCINQLKLMPAETLAADSLAGR